MDILFISLRGSMYRYFDYLSRELPFKTKLVDFSPRPQFSGQVPPLTNAEIAQGIAFQLQRKRSKYSAPDWAWKILQQYYVFQYLRFYKRFYRLLKKWQPRCIALWNGHRLPEFANKQIAKQLDIPVVHFENGLLPDTTTFDLKGVNNENSLPREADFYRSYTPRENLAPVNERSLVTRKFHRAKKARAAGDDFHKPLPKKFVFVPFQVKFDSQVLLNSPRIKTMHDLFHWVEQVVENCSDQSLIFVIKEHPTDPHKYTELYKKNPKILFSNRDTKELIEKAEAVITVNSSVGLEAILLHQRVIVLGAACYAINGLSKPVDSPTELLEEIENLRCWTPDIELIEKFLAYLKYEYCVPVSWRSPDSAHLKSLQQRFSAVIQNSDRCITEKLG